MVYTWERRKVSTRPDRKIDVEIRRFLLATVGKRVQSAQGQPLTTEQSLQLLKQFGFTNLEFAVPAPEPAPATIPVSPVRWAPTPAWNRAVATIVGSEEMAQQRAEQLWTQILGVYHGAILSPARHLQFRMSIPGQIAETNGKIRGPNELEWKFEAKQAFPFGYEMRVNSFEPNARTQAALLGTIRLGSVVEMRRHVELLAEDAPLQGVLKQAVSSSSRRPFQRYRRALEQAENIDEAALSRLRQLEAALWP